jgi:hypothetical protein
MGKLKGYLPIEGTVGELSFIKTEEDGIIVRSKGGISRNRIANGDDFRLTRQNNDEFARAGYAVALVRAALKKEVAKGDRRATSRLMKQLMAALKADGTSARGLRTVQDGNPGLLKGFEFNKYSPLAAVLILGYTSAVNRTTGALTVHLDPYTPMDDLVYPDEASHYEITVTGAELDFASRTSVSDVASTGVLPINGSVTSAATLTAQLTAASTATLLLAVSVSFYQSTNGTLERMANRENRPLAILEMDHS